MIEIKNLRSGRPSAQWAYRCDRVNRVLGNHVGKGLSRMEAIAAFEAYLDAALADKSEPMNSVRAEMNSLYRIYRQHGRLELWCWCSPKPCHTSIIKARLESVL